MRFFRRLLLFGCGRMQKNKRIILTRFLNFRFGHLCWDPRGRSRLCWWVVFHWEVTLISLKIHRHQCPKIRQSVRKCHQYVYGILTVSWELKKVTKSSAWGFSLPPWEGNVLKNHYNIQQTQKSWNIQNEQWKMTQPTRLWHIQKQKSAPALIILNLKLQ